MIYGEFTEKDSVNFIKRLNKITHFKWQKE